MVESLDSSGRLLPIRLAFWIVTICAGFLQAWAARFYISPDGNCYLDVASAYLRRDWNVAINAYWSPFFSWLLALCLWVIKPDPYWESTLLHVVNFIGLLIGLRCFEFFFLAFLSMRRSIRRIDEEEVSLHDPTWWALGYGLFPSTSLFVVSITTTTPDIWVCAITYLAAGLMLRIYVNRGGWVYFAALGLVLGCGYLTKSFYLPLSFVFLGTALLASRGLRRNVFQAGLALILLAVVTGPFIVAISRAKHRITFGDTGKIAYAIVVDQITQPFFWQGENGTGTPKHPTRELLARPRVYEFAAPVGGSYPPAYDFSYWMEGVTPQFRIGGQLRVLRQSAGTFFLILVTQIEYGVGLLVLFFFLKKPQASFLGLRRQWHLWVPAMIGCLGYAIVAVEGRYVAPFLPLLWIAAFSSCLGPASKESRRVRAAVVLAILCISGVKTLKFMVSDFAAVLSKPQNTHWEVADALHRLGVRQGGKVAGLSGVAEAHWARLAGVTIVSEIPLGEEDAFWSATPELRGTVFAKLASTGATVLVTKAPPPAAITGGWVPLGSTGYYAYRLPSPASTPSLR